MKASSLQILKRFIRFGLVGASGVVVDMGMLYLLTDPKTLAWPLALGKIIAAEIAIVNNFIWNETWTFQDLAAQQTGWRARWGRFGRFNLICLAGIGISVSLLEGQVGFLHWNVYLANMIAILVASIWNFGMNLKFGWTRAVQEKP